MKRGAAYQGSKNVGRGLAWQRWGCSKCKLSCTMLLRRGTAPAWIQLRGGLLSGRQETHLWWLSVEQKLRRIEEKEKVQKEGAFIFRLLLQIAWWMAALYAWFIYAAHITSFQNCPWIYKKFRHRLCIELLKLLELLVFEGERGGY